MSIINQKGPAIFMQTILAIILISFIFAVFIHMSKDDNKIKQDARPINLEPFNPNYSK